MGSLVSLSKAKRRPLPPPIDYLGSLATPFGGSARGFLGAVALLSRIPYH